MLEGASPCIHVEWLRTFLIDHLYSLSSSKRSVRCATPAVDALLRDRRGALLAPNLTGFKAHTFYSIAVAAIDPLFDFATSSFEAIRTHLVRHVPVPFSVSEFARPKPDLFDRVAGSIMAFYLKMRVTPSQIYPELIGSDLYTYETAFLRWARDCLGPAAVQMRSDFMGDFGSGQCVAVLLSRARHDLVKLTRIAYGPELTDSEIIANWKEAECCLVVLGIPKPSIREVKDQLCLLCFAADLYSVLSTILAPAPTPRHAPNPGTVSLPGRLQKIDILLDRINQLARAPVARPLRLTPVMDAPVRIQTSPPKVDTAFETELRIIQQTKSPVRTANDSLDEGPELPHRIVRATRDRDIAVPRSRQRELFDQIDGAPKSHAGAARKLADRAEKRKQEMREQQALAKRARELDSPDRKRFTVKVDRPNSPSKTRLVDETDSYLNIHLRRKSLKDRPAPTAAPVSPVIGWEVKSDSAADGDPRTKYGLDDFHADEGFAPPKSALIPRPRSDAVEPPPRESPPKPLRVAPAIEDAPRRMKPDALERLKEIAHSKPRAKTRRVVPDADSELSSDRVRRKARAKPPADGDPSGADVEVERSSVDRKRPPLSPPSRFSRVSSQSGDSSVISPPESPERKLPAAAVESESDDLVSDDSRPPSPPAKPGKPPGRKDPSLRVTAGASTSPERAAVSSIAPLPAAVDQESFNRLEAALSDDDSTSFPSAAKVEPPTPPPGRYLPQTKQPSASVSSHSSHASQPSKEITPIPAEEEEEESYSTSSHGSEHGTPADEGPLQDSDSSHASQRSKKDSARAPDPSQDQASASSRSSQPSKQFSLVTAAEGAHESSSRIGHGSKKSMASFHNSEDSQSSVSSRASQLLKKSSPPAGRDSSSRASQGSRKASPDGGQIVYSNSSAEMATDDSFERAEREMASASPSVKGTGSTASFLDAEQQFKSPGSDKPKPEKAYRPPRVPALQKVFALKKPAIDSPPPDFTTFLPSPPRLDSDSDSDSVHEDPLLTFSKNMASSFQESPPSQLPPSANEQELREPEQAESQSVPGEQEEEGPVSPDSPADPGKADADSVLLTLSLPPVPEPPRLRLSDDGLGEEEEDDDTLGSDIWTRRSSGNTGKSTLPSVTLPDHPASSAVADDFRDSHPIDCERVEVADLQADPAPGPVLVEEEEEEEFSQSDIWVRPPPVIPTAIPIDSAPMKTPVNTASGFGGFERVEPAFRADEAPPPVAE
jgi:hypothetical protein